MNGAPWTLQPGDMATIYMRGRSVASGTVGYGWLKVHGIMSVRLDRLESIDRAPLRLVPRQNPNPHALGEKP